MDFRRVEAALGAIGLRDQYIGGFRENCLEDDRIDFDDEDIVSTLKDIIPKHGHRAKFMKAFKALVVASLNAPGPNQTPPCHEKDLNIAGIKIDGEGKFGDARSYIALTFTKVGKVEVFKHDYSGIPRKKVKLGAKDRVEFDIVDPIGSFTGREKELEDLHTKIKEIKKEGETMTVEALISVISGMGGVGKTQTMRKYIQEHKLQYDHIIWINSDDENAIRNNFLRLAEVKLGMHCKNDQGHYISDEDIKNEVYTVLCERRCLIVFDDAENLGRDKGIRKFLPSIFDAKWQTPTIVVTSRSRSWGECEIQLGGLTQPEIWQFFQKYLQLDDTEKNRGLSKEIGDLCERLPLVLQQVLALIKTKREEIRILRPRSYTMKDFLISYEKGRKKYLKIKDEHSPFSDSVYTIFSMTFERLSKKKHGPLALRCISMMSFLSPLCIPKPLFSNLKKSNEKAYSKSLIMLNNYNLTNACDQHFEIHRTIQEVTVELLRNSHIFDFSTVPGITQGVFSGSQACVDEILLHIMDRLQEYLPQIDPNDPRKHASFQNAFRLASHCKHMFTRDSFYAWSYNLVKQTKDLYSSETNALLCAMITEHKKNYTEAESNTLSTRNIRLFELQSAQAFILNSMSNYHKAMNLYKQILPAIEDQPDAERSMLTVKVNIATTLSNLGRYKESEQELKKVLNMKLKDENASVEVLWHCRATLADVSCKLGLYEASVGIYRNLIQELEDAGRPSEDRHWLEEGLAHALMMLGKYDDALKLFPKVISYKEGFYGKSHPATLTAKSGLANLYSYMGKYDDALKTYQQILDPLVEVVGEDHDYVLQLKGDMAPILSQMGRTNEGLAMLEDTSSKLKRHGDTLPDFLTTELNIAMMEKKLGRHESAYSRLEYVCKARRLTLGDEHPSVLSADREKAIMLIQRGKYKDAEIILQEVVKLAEKLLGASHRDTLQAKISLVSALNKLERLRQAVALAEEVVRAAEEELGSNHLATLEAKIQMADVLFNMKRHTDAFKIYQATLPKLKWIVGNVKTQGLTLSVRISMAEAMRDSDRIRESIPLFQEVIQDISKAQELTSWYMITAKTGLAKALHCTGWIDAALGLYEEAKSLAEQTLGTLHPTYIVLKRDLANVVMANDPGVAVKLCTEAVEACETFYGKNSRITGQARKDLAEVFLSGNTISSINKGLAILEEELDREGGGLSTEDYWILKIKSDTAVALLELGRIGMAYEIFIPIVQDFEASRWKFGLENSSTLEACKFAHGVRAMQCVMECNEHGMFLFPHF